MRLSCKGKDQAKRRMRRRGEVPGFNNVVIVVCSLNLNPIRPIMIKNQIDVLSISQNKNINKQTNALFNCENVESLPQS
jgi:hypothetical protein